MDIQQYISSGIIEAYVLGIASEEEVRELEVLSTQYPEVAAAVEACRETMEDFADLHRITPPPELKASVWAAIEADQGAKAGTLTNAPYTTTVTAPAAPNVTNFERRGTSSWKTAAAAAMVLLAGSILFNIILWNRTGNMSKEVAALQAKQQQLTDSGQAMQARLAAAREDMKVMSDPAMKPVLLAGVGTHTGSKAMVMWNTSTKAVYLAFKNMPPAPSGKQYQLWAIVDGKPIDAGMYAANTPNDLKKMKDISNPQMFAITLEKEGGSPTPTMEEMYVAGKI